MFKKGEMKDFLRENLLLIIILVVALALLFMLYFSGAISPEGIKNPTAEFGRGLIELFGAGR